MKGRSSGSSDDNAPSPRVDTACSLEPSKSKPIDQSAAVRRSPTSQQDHRFQSATPTSARSRTSSANTDRKDAHDENGSIGSIGSACSAMPSLPVMAYTEDNKGGKGVERRCDKGQPSRSHSSWRISLLTLFATLVGIALFYGVLASSATLHCDAKGCRMSYLRPSYVKFDDFDTEHTQFASKYSLYLYREQGTNIDAKVSGIPVLFIPGNAGSYKQVRPIASEAANYFHDVLQHDPATAAAGIKNLDFFTVDFNEDFTAFDGQTMLDQAEYVNEAVRYILSLYLDPRISDRDPGLPDPTSVIVLGHSMGGIVARTMLIMPNYQSNSVNTIITMSAPHARPPVTFDPRIVRIYEDINEYWRSAYSQEKDENNPLAHVTLVSIAGGGLDTVVPSDYAGLESIVPDTHGFTVFTSTIPNVWTSMDHQAIMWCDQFRKVITRALYDLVDISRASQTKSRAERMAVFRKSLLTGMEDMNGKTLHEEEPSTLLTLEDGTNPIVSPGGRLVLRNLGAGEGPKTHLLPVPPSSTSHTKSFTLLSNATLQGPGGDGPLEVLFCSVFYPQPGQTDIILTDIDLVSHNSGATKLACRNAASDVILLPASTRAMANPFFRDNEALIQPLSYLQYDVVNITDYQFVAIVDKAGPPSPSWVVAEFSDRADARSTRHINLSQLLAFGLQFHLPSARPMVTEINIPSVQSSLLAYNFEIDGRGCIQHEELFAPLIRQYVSEPYESKYFVNARRVEVSLHGVSPYMPPPLRPRSTDEGISFQIWTDPTCASSISVRLSVDPLASLGKLYMRYRTVFASFPILIVALVLRQQFRIYDATGVFISFSESLDTCLRRSLPLLFLSLTLLSLTVGQFDSSPFGALWPWRTIATAVDFSQNDLLSGTHDPLFWFLVPLIGLVCIGVCVVFHYMALILTYVLSLLYGIVAFQRASSAKSERKRVASVGLMPTSSRRRLVTTGILLFLVSTVVPYQFAYVVACLVQLGTSVRALWFVRNVPSPPNTDFSNYVHSVFLLMFWVLPINLPTLVVWVRNLAIHWLAPLSSHHNLLSVLPFVLLVETLTTGRMVPRVTGRLRHVTSVLLFGTAVHAAIYGVSYAYTVHGLVNLIAAWLVVIHSTADPWSLSGLTHVFDSGSMDYSKQRKEP